MNVNELLDTIEDALEEGANVPLSGGKKIVDVEQIRDYLDEIRANLPGELRQAQQIVNDRAQIVETANNGNQTVPTLVYADGTAQTNPSLIQVKAKLEELASA